jgi:peptidoglycan/xylan/chitin deacetylase (PgdA/CDA1 family)
MTQPCPGITCYRIDVTRAHGGAGPRVDVKTVVFDHQAGRTLGLADVLDVPAGALDRVSALASSQLSRGVPEADSARLALICRATAPSAANFSLFTLAGDAIVFYFPPATTGDEAAATWEVRVPYLELVGFLRIRVGYGEAGRPETCLYIETQAAAASRAQAGDGPRIALTFDDGPHPVHTRLILQELSRRRVVATFCVIGALANRYPDVIREIALQGSEIGNHSWTHRDLTRLGAEEVRGEVRRTQELIKRISGRYPAFMRPSGGAYDRQVLDAVGMPVVLWSIDPRDWAGRSADEVASFVVERAHDGAIVLQHDPLASSYESVGRIVDELCARGYRFVTVSELLGLGEAEAESAAGVWRRGRRERSAGQGK